MRPRGAAIACWAWLALAAAPAASAVVDPAPPVEPTPPLPWQVVDDGAPPPQPGFDADLGQEGFSAAVQAYRDGHYDRAQRLFALLAAAEPDGTRRAILHANAGTAAARAQAFGLAIWHLEAALRNAPRDPVARRNLDQVRTRLGQPSLSAASFAETLLRLPLWLTQGEIEQILGLLGALALLALCLRRRAPRLATRGAALLCLLAGLLWLGVDQARSRDLERAVTVAPVAVRAEPASSGKVLFRLEMGAILRAEEQRGEWRLVETGAGGRGWAPAADVRLAAR